MHHSAAGGKWKTICFTVASKMKNYLWVFVLVGIWLIIAPFVLGYSSETTPLWNSILVGVLVTVVGILAYSQGEE